jgi:hypothetical protein
MSRRSELFRRAWKVAAGPNPAAHWLFVAWPKRRIIENLPVGAFPPRGLLALLDRKRQNRKLRSQSLGHFLPPALFRIFAFVQFSFSQ